jgi:hypothetical protein
MDPRSNTTSDLGLSQSDGDMSQSPLAHTPQSFHAPDTGASHFDASSPLPPIQVPAQPAPIAVQPSIAPDPTVTPSTDEQRAMYVDPMPATSTQAATSDDNDTAYDEEWVGKAREIIQRTHADPYLQSQQLSKLKAQYIKLRYNKDVKVSEE